MENKTPLLYLETEKIKAYSSTECARTLYLVINELREDSFYSKKNKPLSNEKLQNFLSFINGNKRAHKNLQSLFYRILECFDFSSLLNQTGLSKPQGFLSELGSRIIEKIIPRHSNRPNFKDLLYYLFPNESDAQFFKSLSHKDYHSILTIFDKELASAEEGKLFIKKTFLQQILNSLVILSAEALVISEGTILGDIRWTFSGDLNRRHPFLELNKFLHQYTDSLTKYKSTQDNLEISKAFHEIILSCRQDLNGILEHLEGGGLSVDLVYQVEVLGLFLERINSLAEISFFTQEKNSFIKTVNFFSTLILDEQKRRSVQVLIEENTHFLARKIIDHAGEKGDNYIARNSFQSQTLLRAALGAGFITAFTTLFKLLLYNLNAAFFFQGLFAALNFAGSFILMQFLHLTLATKQPAMTAAALARRMTLAQNNFSELRKEMKNILRSQALAAMGNICAVIPTSYGLFLLWEMVFQSKFMSHEEALIILESHNPLHSLTIFYALLTGALLSSTGIIHGWVENWMIFRGIPRLLSDSFLIENFMSPDKRKKLGKWLEKNLAGVIANTALGFFLAFAPIFGKFFALPLEVRHVTLSTGTLTFALASLSPEEIIPSIILNCISAITFILAGNILTSFVFSMWLALKAKGWNWHDVKNIFKVN
jgi:site-specific recombinase